jgi:hypothetical protein
MVMLILMVVGTAATLTAKAIRTGQNKRRAQIAQQAEDSSVRSQQMTAILEQRAERARRQTEAYAVTSAEQTKKERQRALYTTLIPLGGLALLLLAAAVRTK